jgi:hypothetical protein
MITILDIFHSNMFMAYLKHACEQDFLSDINLCFSHELLMLFNCLQIVQLKEGTTVVATSEGKRVAFRYYLVIKQVSNGFILIFLMYCMRYVRSCHRVNISIICVFGCM